MHLSITLAHLSDVHLSPLPTGSIFRNFRLKRVVGGINWKLRRRHWHTPAITSALIADIKSHAPHHIALTGDLVNLSAEVEFQRAAQWLKDFGPPDRISFVPGNHDAYVPVPWEKGLQHFAPYMQGSMAVDMPLVTSHNAQPFPYVRFKGNLALIGLTTGLPQHIRLATGMLGEKQLNRLGPLLEDLRRKGCYRCIMIHHPPMPGLAPPRKALTDAAEFCQIIETHGAELILHGHNHRNSLNWIESKAGRVPVVGVASASMAPSDHHEAASWNLFEISRNAGQWFTTMTTRSLDPAINSFKTAAQYALST